jgi:hypothetical protein
MRKNRAYWIAGLLSLLCGLGWLAPAAAANSDDFGNIVHHIEAEYHVHQNYRFLMGFAGVMVKASHFAGAKEFKAAIFEDQNLFRSEPDTRLDEIVQSAGKSGWRPLVKSFSRHGAEHDYIYVQGQSKGLKLLLVTVEPDEAVVVQLKIDADKLSDFINEHTKGTGER